MSSEGKTRTLTIFRGLPWLKSADDFIDKEELRRARIVGLRRSLRFTGSLYIPAASSGEPDWVSFLREGVGDGLPAMISKGISAVLVVKHEKRFFAITFGHRGRGMLAGGAYELDFGLKVALNRVNSAQLRSVDTKSFEDVVISTRTQSSQRSELSAFGIDIYKDLLRGVVGEPKNTDIFKRIAGSDAAVVVTTLEFCELDELFEELSEAFESKDYIKEFPWVDRVKQVRDTKLLASLDGLLTDAIRSGQTGSMHLAPSQVVDWEKIESFSFSGSGQRNGWKSSELQLEGYLKNFPSGKLAQIDVDSLRRHMVRVKFTNRTLESEEFSVYDCLVWETDNGGTRYALMDGRWFEIEVSFARTILTEAATYLVPGSFLVAAGTGEDESAYNNRAAGIVQGMALLDKKLIRIPDTPSGIEVCDLMSIDGSFIHVKKRGQSSTLSHLFSQGSVSATLFSCDSTFREKLNERLTSDGNIQHASLVATAARPDPKQFKIVYAIIAKRDASGSFPELPFFSAVNLVQHGRQVSALGFEVQLRYIELR